MFGGRQKREATEAHLGQEVNRLKSLTAEQIAVELIGMLGAQALVRVGLFSSAGWGGTGDGNVYRLSRAGREAVDRGSVEDALGGLAAAG